MPTAAGLIFFLVAIYFAAYKPDAFLGLLVFSAIFPATSAINFGSLWIMPYYLLAPIFVVQQFNQNRDDFFARKFYGKRLFILFGSFATFTALLYPLVFVGIQVYSPRLGSSDETFYTFPLVFSVGNVAQAAYLILNILVVFAAASTARKGDLENRICPSLNATFYCLTGTIGAELICQIAGAPFPYQIIENSPVSLHFDLDQAGMEQRLHGTCGEPSYAGLILVGFFAAYFYHYYVGKSSPVKAILAAVALFLTRSSSGILALGIVGALLVVLHPPIRFPWLLHVRRSYRLAPVVVGLGASLASPAVRAVLQEWLLDKNQTGSYLNRTTMDLYAGKILTDTYGIGVGLGSYRPSSLVASALGCLGIVGTILFFAMIYRVCMHPSPHRRWMQWAFYAALLDMCIAIPDITHPILWSFLALVVYFEGDSVNLALFTASSRRKNLPVIV